MRKFIPLALLFVLSFANFGQKVSLQTEKVKPTPTPKTQKVKPKTAAKTQKIVKPKTAKTTPKIVKKTKPKAAVKAQKVKPKAGAEQKITTVQAKTSDGKDITLKANGTWAYTKPEPTPKPSPTTKPSPVAKVSPTQKPSPVAATTPTPNPNPVVKASPTAKVKPAKEAKTKPAPTPSNCDLALADAPSIRGLKLGMSRDAADEIIPTSRVRIINSSDIISYPQTNNARGFEDIYQISAEFEENKLSALEIVYGEDEQKWKNAKEFAEVLSGYFNISAKFWKYNARNPKLAEMQCKEFTIKIDAEANELSLEKISALQKAAQEIGTQKKVFKP